MTIEYDQPNGGNSGTDSEQRENNGRSGRQSNREDDTSDLTNKAGDPGRTPGSAEGVEDFDKTGNE